MMTSEEINTIGHQLLAIGAIWRPEMAFALAGLLDAATQLNTLIRQVREHDPAAWTAVETDYSGAAAAFRSSVVQ